MLPAASNPGGVPMLRALKRAIRRAFRSTPRPRVRDPEARKASVDALETLFFEVCGALAPDLFIEAGAKDAFAARRVRGHLPEARIVAFEANPFTYKRFVKKIDYPGQGVEYLHRALSDHDGSVSFNVRVVEGKMAADGQGSMLAKTRSEVGTVPVEVACSRIDSFFPPGSFRRCAVWMDVEGASRQVLTGAVGALPGLDAVFIEVEDRENWEGQWLAKDVEDFLRGHDIVPVGRDFQSVHQNNVLFLRRSALENPGIRALVARLPPEARL